MRTGRILLVDDEATAREALEQALQHAGYEVLTASDAFAALELWVEARPDVVISDLLMPAMSGVDLLRKLLEHDSEAQVILLSAHRDVDTAVAAVREGAVHFLCKPVDLERLLEAVDSAVSARKLRLRASTPPRSPTSGKLLGQSPEMQRLRVTISQVAPSRAAVLISGESGTGKELIAEAIHRESPRASGPLVRSSCAALASRALESELFGHERGAFQGADRMHRGRLERAHGGTLFLDEVGEMPLSVQVKLLSFLQERTFERVGGNVSIEVDVRVVAATNREMASLVAAGSFREDLFYRLNVVALQSPPLRDRATDIPLLAAAFLEQYARDSGRPARRLSDAALAALVAYGWPGNVRELENVIERAVVLANGEVIGPEQLPAELLEGAKSSVPRIPGASMEELERYAILSTLQANGGSTLQAARTLGISVRKIQYRLRQYADTPRSKVSPLKQSPAPELAQRRA
jgi:DNA-binding NtrC family response regulator